MLALRVSLYAGAFLVLASGLQGGSQLYDTGELVAAAWDLGASHPPGQPLHALLGQLVSWLPIGSIPFRIALLSTLSVFAAARCAGLLTETLGSRVGVSDRALPFAVLATEVAVLLSPSVARQATRVEVYGTALALTLGALVVGLRHRSRLTGAIGGGLLLGLSAALHPPHAMLGLFALLALLIGARDRNPSERRWLPLVSTPLVLLGTAAAVYVYLPLRASAGASMWGDPTTLGGFYDYASGAAYRMNQSTAVSSYFLSPNVGRHVLVATGILPPFLGLAWLFAVRREPERRQPILAIFAAASAALIGPLFAELVETNPDSVAYAGPAVALFIVFGVLAAATFASSENAARRYVGLTVVLLIGLHPLGALSFAEHTQSDHPALDAYRDILLDVPPRALVLAETDFVAGTWFTERTIAGARPDAAVFVVGLSTSSWHWRSLDRHPLYSGDPVAGDGATAKERYVQGALGVALERAPIVSEIGWPVREHGTLRGAHLVLAADGVPSVAPRHTSAMGERWSPHLSTLTSEGLPGDSDSVHSVVREFELTRAQRLLLRSAPTLAQQRTIAALRADPWAQELVERETFAAPTRPFVPLVRDPSGVGLSRADAVRAAAGLVAAMGASETAEALLSPLVEDDPRSLLQLGWIALAAGDGERARNILATVRARAPELEDASTLERALR
ncbi:MAG: DUF2723 domain-containing protein [Myxococcota bacterium]